MKWSDVCLQALLNLWQRKARTLLTVLGVIIGTASIVMMLALGRGNEEMFMEQIAQNINLTQINVMNMNYGMPSSGSGNSDQLTLDEKAAATFASLPNVKTVVPYAQTEMFATSHRIDAQMWGQAIPAESMEQMEFKLAQGRLPDPGSRALEVLVGAEMMYSFTRHTSNQDIWSQPPIEEGTDLLGVRFTGNFGNYYVYQPQDVIEGQDPPPQPPPLVDVRVVGILERTGQQEDYNCYFSLEALEQFVKKNKKFAQTNYISAQYQGVTVRVGDMTQVIDVLDSIKAMGYQAYSDVEYIEQMKQESARQQIFWAIVGGIALLVSAIGIANTMLTSIMERKREIGVMKVLGCPLGTMTFIYIMEAAFIGLIGGLIGLGLSFGISALLSSPDISWGTALGMGGGVRFVISPQLCLITALGAMGIGILAGLYPALRTMRMSPLAALREE